MYDKLELVVDSVEVLSSNKVQCQDGDIILLDSMQFRRKYYTSVTCGDRLSLYQINPSSTLVSLDDKSELVLYVFLKMVILIIV